MKILDKAQLKAWDTATLKAQGISSKDLMYRASEAFVEKFVQLYSPQQRVVVCCGTGNNGGDGVVIAYLLSQLGYSVEAYIYNPNGKSCSADNQHFQNQYEATVDYIVIDDVDTLSAIDGVTDAVMIDALFGYGFEGELAEEWQPVVDWINEAKEVVAVDLPSGVGCHPAAVSRAVEATHTISFEIPKLPFFLPELATYVGEWHVINIGLNKEALSEMKHYFALINADMIKQLYRPRKKFSHKGNYGRGLLIAGSRGMLGACQLAAQSALRGGIGLLYVLTPRIGYSILQSNVPEAMVLSTDAEDRIIEVPSTLDKFEHLAIGPGLGTHSDTAGALVNLCRLYGRPMVIDADALNILSEQVNWILLVPKGSIITPHPKEFDRLFGDHPTRWARIQTAQQKAQEHEIVILLKGRYTAIATPDGQVFFNSTGHAGMATGGSGDVLTGLLLSMLCQGYPPNDAAIMAAYLHGLSAEIALQHQESMESMLPSDICRYMGLAYRSIQS